MTTNDQSRRALLQATVCGVVALGAGCLESAEPTDDTGESTTETADANEDESPASDEQATTSSDEQATTSSDDEPTDDTTAADTSENEITLPSLDVEGSPGGLISIAPDEQVVLLNFFATWCPPCGPEMEHLRAVQATFEDDPVSIISITQETDEALIESFWEEYDGNWPVVMDPDMRATLAHDVTTIPTLLVRTPDGTEVDRETGAVGESTLEAMLEAGLEQASLS